MAPVVHDDDLVGHALPGELGVEVPYCRRQRLRLVARGNDDGEQVEAHQSGADTSSQSGWVPAWADISSMIARTVVLGLQPQTRAAFDGSRTIHGMSNGRGAGSGATGWEPNRSSHQSLICLRDIAEAAPPPTFTIRSAASVFGAASCAVRSGSRSCGWRQSRTWWPFPPNPMYLRGLRRRWLFIQ